VRPLYDHLLTAGRSQNVDLFLFSRGGDVSVPWRIVSMFREFCDALAFLVPYKAHSAATLMSLGADKIVMGRKAELGPIDPTLTRMTSGEASGIPQEISVEDVNSYISFIRERANINDQAALAQVVSILADNLTPLNLGSVNRQNSHIRLVARKLLTSRREKLDEAKLNSIVETLTEKMYSHGHAIGRREAQEIGLPVEMPDDAQETLLWNLYLEYEKALALNEPLDPLVILSSKDHVVLSDVPIAFIESEAKTHMFTTSVDLRKRRQVPTNPQISLNIGLSLPAGVKPEQIPGQVQQVLQQMVEQVSKDIPRMVQREIVRQSPEVGIDMRVYGGRWLEQQEDKQ